ncbi:MAG TPA: DUF427 domain-containing protein [Microbacteriaceae bacterium]|nr:DUF427 domain-containing protein [Microbacteriaceae bacterium]
MRATLNGEILAEAPDDDVIHLEGNVYFPPNAVRTGVLSRSVTPYTCPWKGDCQYYHVEVAGDRLADRAWAYLAPLPGAIDRAGRDFTGYVCFWKEIVVS